jgi:poly(3-hydroxybutyrate) depolymerase
MHAGPVVGHVAAAVRAAQATQPSEGISLEQALQQSYASPGVNASVVDQTRDEAILVPMGLTPGRNVPIVVAFAYNANPSIPFQVWRRLAQENHWIVYASKDFWNGVLESGVASSTYVAGGIEARVESLAGVLPIDTSRIIVTGYSGGANFAEFVGLQDPGFAAAVIANSGRIPDQLFRARPTRGFLTMPTASDFAGSRREVVLIASPGDSPFFGDSLANQHTWQSLGWDTLFVSIPGGHVQASPPIFDRIIAWLTSQPSWAANP